MPKFKTSRGYRSPVKYGTYKAKTSPIHKVSGGNIFNIPKINMPKLFPALSNTINKASFGFKQQLTNLTGNLIGKKNQGIWSKIWSSPKPFKAFKDHLKDRAILNQTRSGGLNLSKAEKAQAKRLGMSEYQWRSGANLTHSQRHGKRMYEKKHKTKQQAKDFLTTNIRGLQFLPKEESNIRGLQFKPKKKSMFSSGLKPIPSFNPFNIFHYQQHMQ